MGGATVGGVYPFLEAKWCRVLRQTIAVPNLPRPFQGTTVALLADVHHGPFVPLGYIRDVVKMTNALSNSPAFVTTTLAVNAFTEIQDFGPLGSPLQPDGTAVTTHLDSRIRPGVLLANYLLASAAGVIWYFQFFFYSMGQTLMGKYDFSSWTLHMASIIIFATLWGIALKEWQDTSRRTKLLVSCGLFLLIASTVVVGYGNFLVAR